MFRLASCCEGAYFLLFLFLPYSQQVVAIPPPPSGSLGRHPRSAPRIAHGRQSMYGQC